MMYVRQTMAVFVLHLRTWWRNPRHAVVSVALSIVFLLIADHLFVVWMGEHMSIGLHAENDRVARNVAREFLDVGLTTIRYDNAELGQEDLDAGRIVAFVSVHTGKVQNVDLIFAGRNPLLDRELAGLLLRVAERVSESYKESMRISLKNNRYASEDMSIFMAAGTLPFLILILASINCGLPWRHDWDRGTLYRFLVTPVRRSALVLGRMLGGLLITFLTLTLSLFICSHIVSWQWPDHVAYWFCLIFVQVFFAGGLFFAIAALCRGPMLYDDITYMSTLVLMFISGVIVPVVTMPQWERFIAYMTPTFYAVRSMRAVMTGYNPFMARDVVVLILWGVLACWLGYLCLSRSTVDRTG